jgi:hypothetical protein
MMIDSTAAKIGRSTKKRENTLNSEDGRLRLGASA